ncbi:uncharacterized protein LOC132180080 [Corylus avellana]|uniref:uncharacterized protein LOC132180080 n=1 Tax=Corylus avellana TaxID=13451 RepID=UPI00286C01E0|nr:uncharacterized protein LOC132180080 [Corylus avellana]
MPWYIVQYFSLVAGIKFIKEDWHFDNEPIIGVMNSQGDVKNKDALGLIRKWGMNAFPFTSPKPVPHAGFINPPGPHQNEVCTFYCGGKDKIWIQQFSENFNAVAKDPLIAEAGNIVITFYFVGKDCEFLHFVQKVQELSRPFKLPHFDENDLELLRPFMLQHFDKDIQELLRPFKNELRWAVFMDDFNEVISNHGTTILTFLERFEQWKGRVRRGRHVKRCFFELVPCHRRQTGSKFVTSINKFDFVIMIAMVICCQRYRFLLLQLVGIFLCMNLNS